MSGAGLPAVDGVYLPDITGDYDGLGKPFRKGDFVLCEVPVMMHSLACERHHASFFGTVDQYQFFIDSRTQSIDSANIFLHHSSCAH